MKHVIIITFGLLLLTVFSSNGQGKLEVYLQGSSGGQWIKNPEKPEDGTFSYSFGRGLGAGVGHNYPMFSWMNLTYRINYSQKGYTHTYQTSNRFDVKNITNHYRLHYVGLDHMAIITPFKNSREFYFTGGLRIDRLVANNLPTEVSNPQATLPIETNNYHRWSFGTAAGAGYRYNKLFFEAGLNSDLAPSYRNSDTLIRNFIWYVNVGFSII